MHHRGALHRTRQHRGATYRNRVRRSTAVLGSMVLGEVSALAQGHLGRPATREGITDRGDATLLTFLTTLLTLLATAVVFRFAMTAATVFPGRTVVFSHSLLFINKLIVRIV